MDEHGRGWTRWFSGAGARVWAAVLFAVLLVWVERPPRALPADAPGEVFSAARAMAHVAVMASEPRPSGSAHHAAMRGYLKERLSEVGLTPEEYPFVAKDDPYVNVIARVPGTAPTGAIVLMAHYDSVKRAPGAADDASGVAALLEVMRALQPSLPLRNDLIVLLTDGEELGLFGATEFVQHDARFAGVKLVMNLEARGNSGPSLMFETHRENGWVVRAYGKASPRPFATSACLAVYQAMPNDTDFSPFRNAETAGLNFANLEGVTHYHTPLDRAEELDAGSVQHHGAQVLALTRHFGGLDLSSTDAPPVTYFSVFARWLVSYPLSWELPLAAIGAIGALAALGAGLCRKRISALSMAGSLALFGVLCGIFCVLLPLGWASYARQVLRSLYTGEIVYSRAYMHLLEHPPLALLLFSGIILTVFYFAYRRMLPWAGAQGLAAGPIVVCAAAGLATAIALPGFSYFFVLPLYCALVVYWVSGRPGWVAQAVSGFMVALTLIIHAAMLVQFFASLPAMPVPSLSIVALDFGVFAAYWFGEREGGGVIEE
ncbi:MAG: M28 family peptidase [Candidatus Hydrogenedentes bacterium]|nr:M28 family peptidase [Candidatus Hydrogenedentota bacterium]